MIGYLITQMNAQITDVIKQIQVHGDIGQIHHIKTILYLRGSSLGAAP